MKHSFLAFATSLVGLLVGCSSPTKEESAETAEVQLEFLDSIVVESLSEIYLSSKNEETGDLIFKERFLKEFLITDSEGKILSRLELKGEGPNQVSFPMEVVFMNNQLVVKEMSAETKLSFFDGAFNKVRSSPALAQGLNMIEISVTRQSFSPIEVGTERMILGVETNAIDPEWMTPENQKPEFYSHAESGFLYDPNTDLLTRFNLYPDSWQPKKAKEWVGQALPFISVLGKGEQIAVLPRIGNQLFFYQLEGNSLKQTGEFALFHPARNESLKVDPMEQPFLYPAFTDIKGGGKYFLVEFHKEVPLELFQESRAKNENYMMDPEFKQILKRYRQPMYILMDRDGNQRTISQLPVEGAIHYFDKEDVIYLKPESNEERDYDVFYRYKILP